MLLKDFNKFYINTNSQEFAMDFNNFMNNLEKLFKGDIEYKVSNSTRGFDVLCKRLIKEHGRDYYNFTDDTKYNKALEFVPYLNKAEFLSYLRERFKGNKKVIFFVVGNIPMRILLEFDYKTEYYLDEGSGFRYFCSPILVFERIKCILNGSTSHIARPRHPRTDKLLTFLKLASSDYKFSYFLSRTEDRFDSIYSRVAKKINNTSVIEVFKYSVPYFKDEIDLQRYWDYISSDRYLLGSEIVNVQNMKGLLQIFIGTKTRYKLGGELRDCEFKDIFHVIKTFLEEVELDKKPIGVNQKKLQRKNELEYVIDGILDYLSYSKGISYKKINTLHREEHVINCIEDKQILLSDKKFLLTAKSIYKDKYGSIEKFNADLVFHERERILRGDEPYYTTYIHGNNKMIISPKKEPILVLDNVVSEHEDINDMISKFLTKGETDDNTKSNNSK